MGADNAPAPHATLGATAWTRALWPDAVAMAEYAGLSVAVASNVEAVERAVAVPYGAAPIDRRDLEGRGYGWLPWG